MEKRIFNKIIKQQMLSYGFEKTGSLEYAKEALDGTTKIVVRAPSQISGFVVGAQFRDFGDYSGKIAKTCMKYQEYELVLCIASIKDYSEEEIISGVRTVMDGIAVYLREGRDAIRERINQWEFGLLDEAEQNRIYAYFGLPLIDPYSDNYILKQIEDLYKQGGHSMLTLEEYYSHQAHYDQYAAHGCRIDIGKEFVTISYDQYPRKYN